jgi:acylpyruvate hydrolase
VAASIGPAVPSRPDGAAATQRATWPGVDASARTVSPSRVGAPVAWRHARGAVVDGSDTEKPGDEERAVVRLATIRQGSSTAAVRIDGGQATAIDGAADVGELLADTGWRGRAEGAGGATHDVASLDFAPLVVRPDKIVCVGLNYRSHIVETGREPPEYPTLFAKFRSSLIGAHDEIELHPKIKSLDWEAELAVVIGGAVRDADEGEARTAIAGYTVLNDVTARDWQNRTLQWLQGKTFEHSTPVGPWLTTTDEFDGTKGAITCVVNGETMQESDVSDLVFGPITLVSYISTIVTLLPGDVIATGTPGGVGAARTPPRFLAPGDVVVTRIEGLGELQNTCARA